MTDMQDPLARACYAMLDAAIAMGKAEQAYAQALAEETWEYSAQAKRGDSWETCTNSETHLEEWWSDKDEAKHEAIRLQEQGRKTRLVRRRVSPPEVVNE